MNRAESADLPPVQSPRGGGDTLAIWRWQGKASRIKALPRSGQKNSLCAGWRKHWWSQGGGGRLPTPV